MRFEGVATIGDLDLNSTVSDDGTDVTATVYTDGTKATATGSVTLTGIGTGSGALDSFADSTPFLSSR